MLTAILAVRLQKPQSANANSAKSKDLLGMEYRECGLRSYVKATMPQIIAATPTNCVAVRDSDRNASAPITVRLG